MVLSLKLSVGRAMDGYNAGVVSGYKHITSSLWLTYADCVKYIREVEIRNTHRIGQVQKYFPPKINF